MMHVSVPGAIGGLSVQRLTASHVVPSTIESSSSWNVLASLPLSSLNGNSSVTVPVAWNATVEMCVVTGPLDGAGSSPAAIGVQGSPFASAWRLSMVVVCPDESVVVTSGTCLFFTNFFAEVVQYPAFSVPLAESALPVDVNASFPFVPFPSAYDRVPKTLIADPAAIVLVN